jgi:hypothetical protein
MGMTGLSSRWPDQQMVGRMFPAAVRDAASRWTIIRAILATPAVGLGAPAPPQ